MTGIATALGALVALFPLAFVTYINTGSLYKSWKRSAARYTDLACSLDSDCPGGYVCVNGKCLPQS
jgi:hypothetical protein